MSGAAQRASSLRLAAPAKLNLFLEVLGRRPDGYHGLATVMHAIDLVDDVTVRLVPGRRRGEPAVSLRCDPPVTGTPEENLAYRAAALLLPADPSYRVELELLKRIPAQAGLGGGSSDAAAVLRAVSRLTGTALPPQEMNRLAARLGADVPFFLTGGTALCEGIGERVTPIPGVPRLTFVLAVPALRISTAAVFADRRLALTASRRNVTVFARSLAEGDVDRVLGPGARGGPFNRLAEVVLGRHPELAAIGRRLGEKGGQEFHVTGSGAGLFTYCPGGPAAGRRLAAALRGVPGVETVRAVSSYRAGSPE
ncbi:MAG: 4-(cytidine 5'-diphospho)-2-C-methyl-D-erythritol kinase [Planctomycetes bacterium]|nr:4-(cytidine 5'-diphospho)-2-C-methyl-D-erythritol kinase [Planctomycetota bacterium]